MFARFNGWVAVGAVDSGNACQTNRAHLVRLLLSSVGSVDEWLPASYDSNECDRQNNEHPYAFSGELLAALQTDAERAEFVDLLRYLFVEWSTRDAASSTLPLFERHALFLQELQTWLTFSTA